MDSAEYQPRISKAWQIENQALVLAISVPKTLFDTNIKKLFLIIDISAGKPTVSLRSEKPSTAEPKGILSDQIRKHLIGARILDVKTDANSNICIDLDSKDTIWKIVGHNSKPVACFLINSDSSVYGKITPTQAFTKRHQVDLNVIYSDLSLKSTMNDLISSLKSPANNNLAGESATSPQQVLGTSQKDLIGRIKRRIRTTKKSLARLQSEVRSSEDVQRSLTKANLLRDHLPSIESGTSRILLGDKSSKDSQIEIQLDPRKTPGENLDLLFKQYKRDRGAFEKLRGVIDQTECYLVSLQETINLLKTTEIDANEQIRLGQKLRLSLRQKKSPTKSPQVSMPYRLLHHPEGAEFRIGKGPNENDQLTKAARGNDWWIHIVQGGGSHIVISSRFAISGTLPPSIQRQAAILAIHYSKARQAREGEVYVTQRQYLRKPKGMRPGLWLVDRSDTLFVRYDLMELKSILGGNQDDGIEDA